MTTPLAAAPPPAAPAPDLSQWRAEFPIFERCTYLNSCSLGALARTSRARLAEHLDQWDARGASAWYDTWWAALEELREGYAWAVGGSADGIALAPHMSQVLTVVAESLDYVRRPRVVTTALDFPTIAYQWSTKPGVELVVLESPDGVAVPLEAFAAAIDERTALVATSHVFFTSGQVQDIAAIARLAHARGALCLIDGYQGAGQLPVDVRAADVDFYASGGLKWLLGGTGTAFVWVRPELRGTLLTRTPGWFGHREQFRFDPRGFVPHDDARRWETGTPALPSVHLQLGGLAVLRQVGIPAVRAATQALTEDLVAAARDRGWRPKVAAAPAERSAIVMLPADDPHALVRRAAERGFIVDARPGHVRVSPFFYNVADDHRALLEAIA